MCIRHLCQEEVGVRGIDLNARRQLTERLYHVLALREDKAHPFRHCLRIVQFFQRLTLCEEIDVVRIFHLIEQLDNLFAGKRHAETDGSAAPCLTHRVEYDDVRELSEAFAEDGDRREIAVRLVNDNDTTKPPQHFLYLLYAQVVACGIVGRTKPDSFRVVITSREELVGIHLIMLIEQHGAILHIIDISTNLVHAVSRFDGYDIVYLRSAEDTVHEVYGLIGTIAQEDALRRNPLDRRQPCLDLGLQRVGVTVVGRVVRVLVGIEEDVRLVSAVFVACGTVRC